MIKLSEMKWEVQAVSIGEIRYAKKILVRKPEVKRTVGMSRSRWEVNIFLHPMTKPEVPKVL
jgi:hypothetical protein